MLLFYNLNNITYYLFICTHILLLYSNLLERHCLRILQSLSFYLNNMFLYASLGGAYNFIFFGAIIFQLFPPPQKNIEKIGKYCSFCFVFGF
jgi:hypothetical protein